MPADLIVPTKEINRVRNMHRERVLAQAAREARDFQEKVSGGRASYAGMLSRLWQQAQRTLELIETASESQLPLLKRTAALRDVGKLLPQLAKAEDNQVKRIGKKAVEDMSERELMRVVKGIAKAKKVKAPEPR